MPEQEHPQQNNWLEKARGVPRIKGANVSDYHVKPGMTRIGPPLNSPRKPKKSKAAERPSSRRRTVEPTFRLRVLAQWAGCCAYCTRELNPADFTIDHVVPLADGGVDAYDNWAPSCKPCNNQKGNQPMLLFLLARLTHA